MGHKNENQSELVRYFFKFPNKIAFQRKSDSLPELLLVRQTVTSFSFL